MTGDGTLDARLADMTQHAHMELKQVQEALDQDLRSSLSASNERSQQAVEAHAAAVATDIRQAARLPHRADLPSLLTPRSHS